MSWLSSFLHPERGYSAAQDQLNKYYNQAQGYQQPYNEHGQQAYTGLSEAQNALLNPQELQDKWVKGYKESEAAKNAEAMAQEHGLNAAGSMGLMGSNTALNAIQTGTSQIGAEDRQKYLDDLMQKYLAGAGIAQNIYGIGANTANSQSQNAMNMGQNSAQMSYGQQNAPGNMFGRLLGTAAGLAGGAMNNGWKPWGTGGT